MWLKRLFGKSRKGNENTSSSTNSNAEITRDPRLKRLNELLRADLSTNQQKLEFLSLQPILITGPIGYGGSMNEEALIYDELSQSLSAQEWIDACKSEIATPMLKGYAAAALGRKQWSIDSIQQILPFMFDLLDSNERIDEQSGCSFGTITSDYLVKNWLLSGLSEEVSRFVSQLILERLLSKEQPITSSYSTSHLIMSCIDIKEAPSDVAYSLLKKADDNLSLFIINRALSCAKNDGKRRFAKVLKKWLEKNATTPQAELVLGALDCIAKTPSKFKLEVLDILSSWIDLPERGKEIREKIGEILDSLLPLQTGVQVFWSILEKSDCPKHAVNILDYSQRRIPDVFRMHEARFQSTTVPPLGQFCARFISQQPASVRGKLISSAYASLPDELHSEIQACLTAGHNVREISWLAWLKFGIGRKEHVIPALRERTIEELPNQLLLDRIRDSWKTSKLAPELLKLLRHSSRLGQQETATKFAEIVGSDVHSDAFPSCVVFSKYEKAVFVPVIVKALSKGNEKRQNLIQLLENFKATEELQQALIKSPSGI